MTLAIGQFHELFINFSMKMTSVMLFLYYCYILKYKKLNSVKIDLCVISSKCIFISTCFTSYINDDCCI